MDDVDQTIGLGKVWASSLSPDRIADMELGISQYALYLQAHQAEVKLRKLNKNEHRIVNRYGTYASLYRRAIEKQLNVLAAAHENILSTILPSSRRCPPRTSPVDRLSCTPELLEMILLLLPNLDLMRCGCVCTRFRDNIDSSTNLQRKLGFRPADPKTRLYFPTHALWLSEFYLSAEAIEAVQADTVPDTNPVVDTKTADDDDNSGQLRIQVMMDSFPTKLSQASKCNSMLICQPPLKSLQAYTSCCAGPRFWRHHQQQNLDRPPATTITSESGITVGDILDTTARLKKEHSLCPDASVFDHNSETGFVNAQISFETVVKVAKDDPVYVKQVQRLAEEKRKRSERLTRSREIEAYVAAKRAARDGGRPIPTLLEFEATLASTAA
ncbi:hypothetical protein LTR62_005130 [Meristemomyces frigidus]|uniref:F-box domain-containing protein n=1 Tax=Meristemomyces frigidus TaxID=1508187 RepID=A0AAN7YTP6_9PEZI|nr:hypothetical protein LTR62_005130 [Meristemomyces frigidus]